MVIICLLAISAVSAVENDQTTNLTDEINVLDNSEIFDDIDDETYCLSDLNDQIQSVSGDTFELQGNYKYIFEEDISYNGILIEKDNFVIDGKGYCIDGLNYDELFDNIYKKDIFEITANNVTLKNISFINAKNAVRCSGNNLTIIGCNFANSGQSHSNPIVLSGNYDIIEGCTFVNNSVDDGNGGAIYGEGDNYILNNCTFINNSAKDGGAIYLSVNNGTINGCNFINNSATSGAAIYIKDKYSGEYNFNNIIDSCYFSNNCAYEEGSALYITFFYSNSILTLNSSIILSNFGNSSIRWDRGGNGTITNCVILNNTGKNMVFDEYVEKYISVDRNWFGNNASNYDMNLTNVEGLPIDNWYFLDINTSSSFADIALNNLYNASSNEKIIVDDCLLPAMTFTLTGNNVIIQKNVTVENGRAEVPFSSKSGNFSITASFSTASYTKNTLVPNIFSTLQSLIDEAGENGVVQLLGDFYYDCELDHGTEGILINYNNVTINGNGFTINANGLSNIFRVNKNNITLKNIAFINSLGAVNVTGSGGIINNCVFLNNSKNIISNNPLKVDYNWFGNNASNYDVDLTNVEGLTIDNWYFLDIEASSYSANITLNNLYNASANEKIVVNDCTLPAMNFTLAGENMTVQSHVIILNGNAIVSIAPQYANFTIMSSFLTFSFTKEILLTRGDFEILQEIINEAGENSVIELDRDYNFIIGLDDTIKINFNNLTINGNGFTIKGIDYENHHVVTFEILGDNIILNNINFINGYLALKIESKENISINYCNFSHNYHAIDLSANNSSVNYCNFENNGNYFVTMNWKGANGIVNGCNFINNTANDLYGGAVYWQGVNGTIMNSNFLNNTVKYKDGGAIYWKGDNGIVIGCDFTLNYAKYDGGAIYWHGFNGRVIGCDFTNNRINGTLLDCGCAIYWMGDNGIVSESNFTNHDCPEYCQVVYWLGNNGIMLKSLFLNNSGKKAYALDWGGSNGDVNNCAFIGDTFRAIRVTADDLKADYNWFGNTMSNYNERYDILGYQVVTKWYFLDINISPYSADILLNNLYDSSTGQTSIVSNCTLPDMNFTLSGVGVEVQNNVLVQNGSAKVPITPKTSEFSLTSRLSSLEYTKTVTLRGDFEILQELIDNASANSVIELDRNYTYLIGIDFGDAGISITNDNVTINGNGFTIDARGVSDIFNIYLNNVTLKNIIFINASCAINSFGTGVIVENCVFLNNSNNIIAEYPVKADYNWFGNNASNYNVDLTNVEGFTIDNWYFLNMDISEFFADITLNNLYNASNNQNITVGNCELPDMNLKLTCENVTVQNNVVIKNGSLKVPITTEYVTVSITASFLSASYTKIQTVGGEFKLLESLINKAGPNSVIDLDRNYTYTVGVDGRTDGISIIHDNVTINGNGFTIDAKGVSRIFNVENSTNVKIQNITLINGYSDVGAAINGYQSNNLVLSYCNFINNDANTRGGAICLDYSNNSSVSSCSFMNNVRNSVISIVFANNSKINNNIFLNPTCDSAIFGLFFVNCNADYNWFGNNATNYADYPINISLQIDYWLFLNATASPNPLSVFDSSDILFKLYAYKYESKNVLDYDNGKLPVVNLTLTSTMGDIENIAQLDKSVKYTATAVGEGSVTASIENVKCSIFVQNNKRDVNLSVNAQNITYLENETLTLTYNNTATGKVNITLKSKNYNYTSLEDINETIIISNLPAGEYEVVVEYMGDEIFSNATANEKFNIQKVETEIIPTNSTINLYVGEGSKVNYTLNPADAVGNVTFMSNDTSVIKVNSTTGVIEACGKGIAIITVAFIGDNYAAESKTIVVTVHLKETSVDIVGDDPLELHFNKEYTLNVTTTPNGLDITYSSSNESVAIVEADGTIKAIAVGTAVITATFAGNSTHDKASDSITVNVLYDASVSVNKTTLDLQVGDTFTIVATTDPAGLNVTYVADNSGVVTVDENGKVTALKAGKAVITVKVGGDGVYAENSTTVTVTVSKIPTEIQSSAVTTVYNVGKNLVITLKDANGNPLTGVKVTVNLNGAKTYTTDKNGQIKVSTKGLAAKTYTAKITFNGDAKYGKSTKEVKVTIKKAIPKMIAKKKTFKAKTKIKKYTITLKDNIGKAMKKVKVTLKVKGKTYKAKTNKKGKAVFKIKNLKKKGKYKAVIKYKGNKNYKKVTKKVKLTVKASKK